MLMRNIESSSIGGSSGAAALAAAYLGTQINIVVLGQALSQGRAYYMRAYPSTTPSN